MKLSILALVGVIITYVSAHPTPPTHVVHEKREAQLDKWSKRNFKLNRDAIIPLSIGLTQRNLDKGYELLSMYKLESCFPFLCIFNLLNIPYDKTPQDISRHLYSYK